MPMRTFLLTVCVLLFLPVMRSEGQQPQKYPVLYYGEDRAFSVQDLDYLCKSYYLQVFMKRGAGNSRQRVLKYGVKAQEGLYIINFKDSLGDPVKQEKILIMLKERKQ